MVMLGHWEGAPLSSPDLCLYRFTLPPGVCDLESYSGLLNPSGVSCQVIFNCKIPGLFPPVVEDVPALSLAGLPEMSWV